MKANTPAREALEPVLSLSELAARLRASVQTIYDLRSQGRGPRGLRGGRELRFRDSEVDSWLARLEHAGASRRPGSGMPTVGCARSPRLPARRRPRALLKERLLNRPGPAAAAVAR